MVDYRVTNTIFGERPNYKLPNRLFLKELGEEGFRKMMSDFYDIVVESNIANFFPQEEEELEKVKAHNTKFFIEICGGKKYYSSETGHLDMIKMHEDFSITEADRVEWLGCFREVLEKLDVSDEAKQEFWDYIEIFSKHMVNVETENPNYENLVKI